VVPGGWIDLTREGFCYALKVGILSFSVVAQSLVNWPYGHGTHHAKIFGLFRAFATVGGPLS